jgi:hypothetical protein
MELDNFIIGKNRGEEKRGELAKKRQLVLAKKNRVAAAKHRVEESN